MEANKRTDAKKTLGIYINDVEYHVTDRKMTGAEIKALAGIPAGNWLYKEVPGPRPDKLIADDEVVHLKNGDRFFDLPPATKGQGILPLVQKQIDRVRKDFPELVVSQQPDGSIALEIPSYELPGGWSKSETRALMLVPVGYPDSRPGGFYADADLVLASGQNAGGESDPQAVNEGNWRHFCWNSAAWNPHTDGLWKYVKLMLSRFEDPS